MVVVVVVDNKHVRAVDLHRVSQSWHRFRTHREDRCHLWYLRHRGGKRWDPPMFEESNRS